MNTNVMLLEESPSISMSVSPTVKKIKPMVYKTLGFLSIKLSRQKEESV